MSPGARIGINKPAPMARPGQKANLLVTKKAQTQAQAFKRFCCLVMIDGMLRVETNSAAGCCWGHRT